MVSVGVKAREFCRKCLLVGRFKVLPYLVKLFLDTKTSGVDTDLDTNIA